MYLLSLAISITPSRNVCVVPTKRIAGWRSDFGAVPQSFGGGLHRAQPWALRRETADSPPPSGKIMASRRIRRKQQKARLRMIAARATAVLGSASAAQGWLHSPVVALAGRTPYDMLMTPAGAREVWRVLGRIEHGVYS